MDQLSDEGRRVLGDIAARHGVSLDAVEHLLFAVMAGQGTQAQFNHPDLGGMGQWSQGGMIMVGDMFNNGLKAKVDALCTELAGVARTAGILMPARSSQSQSQGGGYPSGFQGQSQGGGYAMGQGMSQSGGVSLFVPGFRPGGAWWPEDLGQPSSTGGQNDLRYAFFPQSRRLAIDIGGRMTVYDTRDHQINGFSQQQSGDQSVTFTSQYGLVRVADLDIVPLSGNGPAASQAAQQRTMPEAPIEPAHMPEPAFTPDPAPATPPVAQQEGGSASPWSAPAASTDEDIFGKIERLAGLHAKGILTDDEFQTKKAELLARL